VYIDGTAYDTDDDIVELDLAPFNTYTIRVVAFPYLDKTFAVAT
jgi:hypothetical protein